MDFCEVGMLLETGSDQLFALEDFEHAAVFAKGTHAWEALCYLKQYLEAQELGKIEVEIPAGVHLVSPSSISIGKGTIIEPGAYIEGPCILGKECTVRHGAYIRGNVLIGDQCVVGHGTEVKHSSFSIELMPLILITSGIRFWEVE